MTTYIAQYLSRHGVPDTTGVRDTESRGVYGFDAASLIDAVVLAEAKALEYANGHTPGTTGRTIVCLEKLVTKEGTPVDVLQVLKSTLPQGRWFEQFERAYFLNGTFTVVRDTAGTIT